MSKYLYISGGSFSSDYAALKFEQDFKGSRLALWDKAYDEGGEVDFEEGDLAFGYAALNLDENTVDEIQSRTDHDDMKHQNYYKVEEK